MSEKSFQKGQAALVLATFLSALVVSLVPIWLVELPPLQDYPAHLARMYILDNLENSLVLQSMYELRWELLPNLAMDVVVPLLTKTIPLFDAGRIYLSVVVLMWIAGPLVLHHALFGRWSLWPLMASFFAYNWCLFTGLVNFVFGAGLFFFVMAGWVYSVNWPMLWRLLLFSILSTVLYFCHLVAFGIYGLSILGFELGRAIQMKELYPSWRLVWSRGILFAQFIIPAIIFLYFSPHRPEQIYLFYWGGWKERLNGLRAPALFELGIVDHLVLIFTAAVFIYAVVTRKLKIHPAFLWAFLLLIVVVVLMPFPPPTLAHMRIPSVMAVLLFAGTAWVGKLRQRSAVIILAVAAALFLARTAVTIDLWHLQDERITEFREAIKMINKGSSVFLILETGERPGLLRSHIDSIYPLLHLADYATIDRSAFVPSVFADTGKQPIRSKGRYTSIYGGIGYLANWDDLPGLTPDKRSTDAIDSNWRENYDYLIVLNLKHRELSPPDFLRVINEGSYFTLFKIEKVKIPQSGQGGSRR